MFKEAVDRPIGRSIGGEIGPGRIEPPSAVPGQSGEKGRLRLGTVFSRTGFSRVSSEKWSSHHGSHSSGGERCDDCGRSSSTLHQCRRMAGLNLKPRIRRKKLMGKSDKLPI